MVVMGRARGSEPRFSAFPTLEDRHSYLQSGEKT